ncbi:MAG: hypothetical protein ACJARI_004370, partial [Bacteroidia bacterium]
QHTLAAESVDRKEPQAFQASPESPNGYL